MKHNFNAHWTCYPKDGKDRAVEVELPYDAMQMDSRSETSPGGVNTGWYDAQDYIYEKSFLWKRSGTPGL